MARFFLLLTVVLISFHLNQSTVLNQDTSESSDVLDKNSEPTRDCRDGSCSLFLETDTRGGFSSHPQKENYIEDTDSQFNDLEPKSILRDSDSEVKRKWEMNRPRVWGRKRSELKNFEGMDKLQKLLSLREIKNRRNSVQLNNDQPFQKFSGKDIDSVKENNFLKNSKREWAFRPRVWGKRDQSRMDRESSLKKRKPFFGRSVELTDDSLESEDSKYSSIKNKKSFDSSKSSAFYTSPENEPSKRKWGSHMPRVWGKRTVGTSSSGFLRNN